MTAKEVKVEPTSGQPKIDPAQLRRNKPPVTEVERKPEPPAVSAGTIDRIVDMVGNPSRDAIRGVTNINSIQAKLLPQLDIVGLMWEHLIEIALFRQDAQEYVRVYERSQPVPPNLIEEFTFRTAQWQRSEKAMNLKGLMDLALAETEARNVDGEGDFGDKDPWKD